DPAPGVAVRVGHLLDRTARAPTAGESPHGRQRPRDVPLPGALGPATAGPSACGIDAGRAGGVGEGVVSRASGACAWTQRAPPSCPPRRDARVVPLGVAAGAEPGRRDPTRLGDPESA